MQSAMVSPPKRCARQRNLSKSPALQRAPDVYSTHDGIFFYKIDIFDEKRAFRLDETLILDQNVHFTSTKRPFWGDLASGAGTLQCSASALLKFATLSHKTLGNRVGNKNGSKKRTASRRDAKKFLLPNLGRYWVVILTTTSGPDLATEFFLRFVETPCVFLSHFCCQPCCLIFGG